MSFEERRKIKPITEEGIESIEKKIKILERKEGNAVIYKNEIAAKKLREEINLLRERLNKRELKQDT